MNISRFFGTIIITIVLFGINDLVNYHVFYKPRLANSATVVDAIPFTNKATEMKISANKEVHSIFLQEMECLQKNIYFEARNQSIQGKEAVAVVTMNRLKSDFYPKTICEVVYQKNQFSWTAENIEPQLENPIEKRKWVIAGNVAIRAMTNQINSPIGEAMFYHANYVTPKWSLSSQMSKVSQIGDHIFYIDKTLLSST